MSSLSSSSGTVGVAGRCGANCGKFNIKDDVLKPPLTISLLYGSETPDLVPRLALTLSQF